MRQSKFTFLMLFLLPLLLLSVSTEITVKASNSNIGLNQEVTISAEIAIPEHYHINLQPDFVFIDSENDNISWSKTVYPAGKKDEYGTEYFENSLLMERNFKLISKPGSDELNLNIIVGYQMCDENGACLMPEEIEKSLNFSITESGNAGISTTNSKIFEGGIKVSWNVPQEIPKNGYAEVTANFELPEKYHSYQQPDYLFIDFDEDSGLKLEETVYPAGEKDKTGVVSYHGNFQLKKKISISPDFTGKNLSTNMYIGYQVCLNNGSCLMPEEIEVPVNFSIKGYADQATDTADAAKENNILKFLLMAFIGGLILNVMPCVLPVLSIKAMHLVGQSQQNKSEIMKGSFAYTAGILVSFLILAAVVVILKVTGESVGWGFQFQNIGFTLSLTAIMFVFSLSLFDVFIISAPGMTMASQASSKEGHWGSFLSGVVAVLLATPCTAPFLGAALGVAFSQPPVMIVLFFLLIGLGLAFPFILLAFWPGVIKKIPRPGEWMNVFKEFMGFLLLGTTVFLLNTVNALVGGGGNFIRVLYWLVALAIASWYYGRFAKPHFSKTKQWVSLFIAVAIVVGSSVFLLDFKETASTEQAQHGAWKKFNPEEVMKLHAEGTPVFVDFGAAWCMTCNTNEKLVLYTDEIQQAFKDKGVALYRGDNTKKDPLIIEWLNKYERAGVPLYLLFYPDQKEAKVFPEIISKNMILDALEKIK